MIFLFTGDDLSLIYKQAEHILKTHGLSEYRKSQQPSSAYISCLTRGLIVPITATFLETSQENLKLDLKLIPRLAKSQNLLFIVSQSWDNRTKLGQALRPYLVTHADLPSNWNKKDIDRGIDFYARQLGMNLTFEVREYLRLALNNNFALLNSGLATIALISTNPNLELVSQIIPSEYATAIDLKEMILQRKRSEISAYVDKLSSHVPDKVILASLKTQFNLLLQTAIALRALAKPIALKQNLSDRDVATFAGISNVKRLYFIRKELEQISIEQLIWLNSLIEHTQKQLFYRGYNLSAKLILMCYW